MRSDDETLQAYKKSHTRPLRECTLVFLLRGDEVLLAKKKRGFGAGRLNGVGGKVHEGEGVRDAAIRETEEEIGVTPKTMEQVATLDFYFLHIPEEKGWNQSVSVYLCDAWEGEPRESEEMAPAWVRKDALPFADMWPDDSLWLPRVLDGERIMGEFLFGEQDAVLDAVVVPQ